jgi:hypothetical protein
MGNETSQVSALIPDDLMLNAAYESGLPGNLGKSAVGRYALARLAGYEHGHAMNIARGQRKPVSLRANATPTAITIPTQILEEAKAAVPAEIAANQSLTIRYALAILNGYSESDALALVTMPRGWTKGKLRKLAD